MIEGLWALNSLEFLCIHILIASHDCDIHSNLCGGDCRMSMTSSWAVIPLCLCWRWSSNNGRQKGSPKISDLSHASWTVVSVFYEEVTVARIVMLRQRYMCTANMDIANAKQPDIPCTWDKKSEVCFKPWGCKARSKWTLTLKSLKFVLCTHVPGLIRTSQLV